MADSDDDPETDELARTNELMNAYWLYLKTHPYLEFFDWLNRPNYKD